LVSEKEAIVQAKKDGLSAAEADAKAKAFAAEQAVNQKRIDDAKAAEDAIKAEAAAAKAEAEAASAATEEAAPEAEATEENAAE